MEGNSISSFENLCKIFEMRIKLDKEKGVKTPSDVIDNYEKYSKKIDAVYNKEFEKEIRSLISPEVTLEKEEGRLKKLIKLLEDRLDKRRELEDKFYESTGRYIDGFQLVVSDEELEEKKNRLDLIERYLTTKNEIDEITSSNGKLKDSLIELENEKDEYVKKNKIMEDILYSELVKCIKNDEYFNKINEDNYNEELKAASERVKENEETLEVTLDSVKSLVSNGADDDYSSYVEDAEKSYYIWKNREIILEIYELVISFEEDFEQMCCKRDKIRDLLEDRNHIKNKLHIEDSDELLSFESLVEEQKSTLNKEKEVLDNIINYNSRIKFKEERLEELEEVINSYDILTILREYGIIESYDNLEEDIPEEVKEEVQEEEEPPKEEEAVLEDIVNDTVDPYCIKEVIDYPRTLNLGLAKLKGESVRENVNKKLNPKPRMNIFDDFTKNVSLEPKNIEVASDAEDKEIATKVDTVKEDNVKEDTPKVEENRVEESKIEEAVEPIWEVPTSDTDIKVVEDNVPVWGVTDNINSGVVVNMDNDSNSIRGPTDKEDKDINKIDIEPTLDNNAFWIPVSDSKLDTKDFPNINIPLNSGNFSDMKDNFGFPDINS